MFASYCMFICISGLMQLFPLQADEGSCYYKKEVKDDNSYVIQSNNYPNTYDSNTECRWEIDVRSQFLQNRILSLSFLDVDIYSAANCRYEYIKIYHKSSLNDELATVCTEGTYEYFISSVLIVFKSSPREPNGKGFQVSYRMKDQESSVCHKTLTVRESTIETENYPHPYPSYQRCSFLIRPASGTNSNIRLDVKFSDLGYVCRDEFVKIWDGDSEKGPQIGHWCGNSMASFSSYTGAMYIVIVTANNTGSQRKGIMATYKEDMCGDTVETGPDDNHRTIIFPPYQHPFTAKVECMWTIVAKPSEKALISLYQSSITCPHSSIYVQTSQKNMRWEDYCTPDNRVFLSRSNKLTVTLKNQGRPDKPVYFRMRYWGQEVDGCDGKIKELKTGLYSQKISSPGHPYQYPSNVHCIWRIMSSRRSTIKVQVVNLDLDEICRDYLAFYDGYVSDYDAKPDRKLCGKEGEFTFISTGYQMTIYFFTDKTHSQNRGFSLIYMDGNEQAEGPIATHMDDDNGFVVIIITAISSLVVIIIIILVIVCIYKRRHGAPMMHQNQPSSGVANSGNREPSSPFLIPVHASAPPPNYEDLSPRILDEPSEPSAPPLPKLDLPTELPPPSYEDAVTKGMIHDTAETPI